MSRRSVFLQLTVEQTDQLDRWIRVGSTPQQVALRARIVRRAGQGESDKDIARGLNVHPRTVSLWRRRARTEGIGCVWEVAAGRGRKPAFGATTVSDYSVGHMPWKTTTPMEELTRFVSLAQTERFTLTDLCEQFGINRKTAYKHLERYALAA